MNLSHPPSNKKSFAKVVFRECRLADRNHIARIVVWDRVEGMLAIHLAEMLNIADSNVRQHMIRHNIHSLMLDGKALRLEFGNGFISPMARAVRFLPRDSIAEFVKRVRSDEAWNIYYQIWDRANEVRHSFSTPG